jgi:DNA mismatch repair protein MutS
VVEAHLNRGEFIPNDTVLADDGIAFALITGPNMAGKSTYLRQTALITIMAQTGSFVPAREAAIGIADRVYCRVGAQDNLARGESTFLVEMNETSYILHTATENSLVIMDEVGRGTGVRDGLALAWAVSEDLLSRIRCRTLFATHYHELSALNLPGMANRSLEVEEQNGELVFYRKLREGPAEESWGLPVARMAGLPPQVIRRAEDLLLFLSRYLGTSGETLSQAAVSPALSPPPPPSSPALSQMDLIIRDLKSLNLERITGLDALNRIQKWKEILSQDILPPRQKKKSPPPGPSLFDGGQ